jgi:hypothetical protein
MTKLSPNSKTLSNCTLITSLRTVDLEEHTLGRGIIINSRNICKVLGDEGLPEFARSMRNSFAVGGLSESLRDLIKHGTNGHLLSYDTAGAYSWLGDKEGAFEQLNRSFELREPILAAIEFDSRFDGSATIRDTQNW